MTGYTIVIPVSVWAWDEFFVVADNEEEALDLIREDPEMYWRLREDDDELFTNPDNYEWDYGRIVETTEYEDEED